MFLSHISHICCVTHENTLTFLYKQPDYDQLALSWQIAKQLSGLNPLSRRNNKSFSVATNIK